MRLRYNPAILYLMRRYLYFTVFISGMTCLAVEMAASRLLGNVFGTSNVVWACIIGLILIYLTVGYFLGGIWADRSPSHKTFYQILLWAAFSISLVPVISRPVLRLAANAFDELQIGVLLGSFSAILILLSIPVTLLGTASPFAIRLAVQDARSIGGISGKIYAISTLGSFLGTFLPVLVLIPTIGTSRTFLVSSAVLLGVGLIGLWKTGSKRFVLYYLWMPILLILLFVWGVRGPDKKTTGQIYETESAYNYIQVLKQGEYYYLRLNEGQGVHSVYHPTELGYNGPWEQVLAAPFFNSPPVEPTTIHSMAIIGLAAGTTARQSTAVFGPIEIDGYEIDPRIVAVGQKFFDMNLPNLNVIITDGRWGLAHSSKRYDVISIDAYRPPYIPWHLTTLEFFEMVSQHLTHDGVMVLNVGRAPDDRQLIAALYSTISHVFPSVHIMDIPLTFNTILYATVHPTEPVYLEENLNYLKNQADIHPLLLHTLQITQDNLRPAPPAGIVFTDDLAPVEWITNNMVLRFLLLGEIEKIQ